VSAQFAWLYEFALYTDHPGVRDFLILPRWNGSVGLDPDGFWRLHLSAGYGVAQLRSEVGYPVASLVEHAVWSYGIGMGVSAGIFHIEVQRLGYMKALEDGDVVSVGPPGTVPSPSPRGTAGTVVSVGLVFPIPLSGSD
jgi:hypothetical protein